MYTCFYNNKEMSWYTLEAASRFFFAEINLSPKPDATWHYVRVMLLLERQKQRNLAKA